MKSSSNFHCLRCPEKVEYSKNEILQIESKINFYLLNLNLNINSWDEFIFIKENFIKLYLNWTNLCSDCREKIYNELKNSNKSNSKTVISDNSLDFFININFKFFFNLSEYLYIKIQKSDVLLPSLLKYFAYDKDLSSKDQNDLEKTWFRRAGYYCSFPNNIKKEYIFKTYCGNDTKEQGKLNGPDFILVNSKTNKTIGLEFTEKYKEFYPGIHYKSVPNIVENILGIKIETINYFPNYKDGKLDLFIRNDDRHLFEFFSDTMKVFIDKRIKAKNYQEVDELIICIGLNSNIPIEYYNLIQNNFTAYIKHNKKELIKPLMAKDIKVIVI